MAQQVKGHLQMYKMGLVSGNGHVVHDHCAFTGQCIPQAQPCSLQRQPQHYQSPCRNYKHVHEAVTKLNVTTKHAASPKDHEVVYTPDSGWSPLQRVLGSAAQLEIRANAAVDKI